jgi:3,4-dihydroxy 2-butanone 4-phosphate synthase / GTP cyclohydrolase II
LISAATHLAAKAGEFDAIEDVIADIAAGRPVVVVDDEDRENEGDLIVAAQFATPETVAFLVNHTSGLLCVGMEEPALQRLRLPQMVPDDGNEDVRKTAFTLSVDLIAGTTTGISAHDRAATVQALANPATRADEFARPGHVFPLRASPGGVLNRAGHTEAAVDLARLAGLRPAGLLGEVVNKDGSMARRDELIAFAAEHDLRIATIVDLIRFRHARDSFVTRIATTRMPTRFGEFTAHVYRSGLDGEEHLALLKGAVAESDAPLVRVHSECLTGDVLGSLRCDCGEQFQRALEEIEREGVGAVVYLRGHEGRGIGLGHKIRAYALQDDGLDTVDANLSQGLPVDDREYGTGAQILADLGIRRMRLMTNNPKKFHGLEGYGLQVIERVPLIVQPNPENVSYLHTKRTRMGHLIEPAGADHRTTRDRTQLG